MYTTFNHLPRHRVSPDRDFFDDGSISPRQHHKCIENATMEYDEVDPAVGHYNDGNRAFLQALLARGTMTIPEAKQFLAAIFTAQEGRRIRIDREDSALTDHRGGKYRR